MSSFNKRAQFIILGTEPEVNAILTQRAPAPLEADAEVVGADAAALPGRDAEELRGPEEGARGVHARGVRGRGIREEVTEPRQRFRGPHTPSLRRNPFFPAQHQRGPFRGPFGSPRLSFRSSLPAA